MARPAVECHYAVLEVDRGANEDEIRKAYRRQALRWHPDKNLGEKQEEAEVRFKKINAAYEVLSDAQERQWYDDHRESILAGFDGKGGEGAGADVSPTPNLWEWFRASCYDGLGDDPKGFFGVYAAVFDDVLRVERERADRSDPGAAAATAAMPRFGLSGASRAEVESFYASWESFTSRLSFAWADLYNPSEVANNRWERRAVEKENKKGRDGARRDYNDLVRSLVAFCKKRDMRVLRIAQERAREKEERDAAFRRQQEAQKAARAEARAAFFQLQAEEEERIKAEEAASGRKVYRMADEHDSAEERDHTVYVCEICHKDFKSEKQYDNHEKSKKHLEELKKLEKKLREEERRAAAERAAATEQDDSDGSDENEDEDEAELSEAQGQASDRVCNSRGDNSNGDDNDDADSDSDGEQFGAFGARKQTAGDESETDSDGEGGDASGSDNAAVMNTTTTNGTRGAGAPSQPINPKAPLTDSEEEQELAHDESDDQVPKPAPEPPVKQVKQAAKKEKGAKAKRAKAAAAATAAATAAAAAGAAPPPPPAGTSLVTEHLCVVCATFFESKNQLHKHLKSTGHAVAPDAVESGASRAAKQAAKAKGRSKR
jgi:DnaJ family protein A protein 5